MILVATDGSAAARAAVRAATDIARASGDRVLLMTAWRELRGDFGIPLDLVMPELVEVERDHAQAVLADAAREVEAAGVRAETLSRHGDPVDEICAVARERDASMIVVGSHGWGQIEGALLGSVLNGLLRRSPCPVLVVPGTT